MLHCKSTGVLRLAVEHLVEHLLHVAIFHQYKPVMVTVSTNMDVQYRAKVLSHFHFPVLLGKCEKGSEM